MSLSQRIHGGPDGGGEILHDFSTNANACGPCPQALAAVQAADVTRYPDPAYTRLRAALAELHQVDAGRIVLAGSASEFIFRITGWAAREGAATVALPRHAYGDYAAAGRAWGLAQSGVEAAPLAWACEPSSPQGGQDADCAARVVPGGTLVLDRAYEPLRLSDRCSMDNDALQGVWQLWSPNKALALTGVRAAYAIAPAAAASAVRSVETLAPSWAVGAHGVAMLEAWCSPAVQHWVRASRETLDTWKRRQATLCSTLGWEVRPSVANFFVASAAGLQQALPVLRTRGIRLRDCASFGLPGWARLSVQPPLSQDALARAWSDLQ